MLLYLVFGVLALAVIGTAAGVLLSRHAIYSALLLVLNFASVAMLYLILGAPFIALAQVTVYAGAIVILFLFVIMLLGAERLPEAQKQGKIRLAAIGLGVILLAELAFFVLWQAGPYPTPTVPTTEFSNPTSIGLALFTKYALPFEVTSVILLVAVVGAIVLTRGETKLIQKELLKKRE